MIDYKGLLKDTSAYKTVVSDKKNGSLSHAYLIVIPDEQKLIEYIKVFEKLIVCESEEACENCRNCRLIEQGLHSDVMNFPENKESVLTADVNKLVEESFYKPVECDKKVFSIYLAHTMNTQSQNKLLKTLEEPPKNVHIILGAVNEQSLLPTVKSRVRKLEIAGFPKERLIECLKDECEDIERLKNAVNLGDDTVGGALSLYNDEKLKETTEFALDLLTNMKTSREVLRYSVLFTEKNIEMDRFLSVLELFFRDLLTYFVGEKGLVINQRVLSEEILENGYNKGSTIHAIERIAEARERKNFNANGTMLLEWLLFQILEGKHKWQKL